MIRRDSSERKKSIEICLGKSEPDSPVSGYGCVMSSGRTKRSKSASET
jgi:hypothetical protein